MNGWHPGERDHRRQVETAASIAACLAALIALAVVAVQVGQPTPPPTGLVGQETVTLQPAALAIPAADRPRPGPRAPSSGNHRPPSA